MNRRPGNEKPHAVRRGASNNTRAWASASSVDVTDEGQEKLRLALAALNDAQQQLSRYANATDTPDWHVIDAADLLDAAAACLADAQIPEPDAACSRTATGEL